MDRAAAGRRSSLRPMSLFTRRTSRLAALQPLQNETLDYHQLGTATPRDTARTSASRTSNCCRSWSIQTAARADPGHRLLRADPARFGNPGTSSCVRFDEGCTARAFALSLTRCPRTFPRGPAGARALRRHRALTQEWRASRMGRRFNYGREWRCATSCSRTRSTGCASPTRTACALDAVVLMLTSMVAQRGEWVPSCQFGGRGGSHAVVFLQVSSDGREPGVVSPPRSRRHGRASPVRPPR